jgi:hypothetical protein
MGAAMPQPDPGPYGATPPPNPRVVGILGAVIGPLCCPVGGFGLGLYSLIQSKKHGGSPVWGGLAIIANVVSFALGVAYFLTH